MSNILKYTNQCTPLNLHVILVYFYRSPYLFRSNLVTFISVNSVASILALILKQPVPSPSLLSIPNLTNCNALYFHVLPNFQTNRLQLIQNSLPRSVVKAHKFSHIILVFISSHSLSIRNYLC